MSALSQILEVIENAANLPVKAIDTDNADNCIVYQYNTVTDNGSMQQVRLQTRIIGQTLADVLSVESAIKAALLDIGDNNTKIQGVTNIVVNGGGTIKDYTTNTIHNILYFIITKKSEVKYGR